MTCDLWYHSCVIFPNEKVLLHLLRKLKNIWIKVENTVWINGNVYIAIHHHKKEKYIWNMAMFSWVLFMPFGWTIYACLYFHVHHENELLFITGISLCISYKWQYFTFSETVVKNKEIYQ